MGDKPKLNEKIIAIAEDYFGPSAPRFIERIAKNHLNKDLEQITVSDINELIKWAGVSMALLTEDVNLVVDFTERLSLLKSMNGNLKKNGSSLASTS